MIHLFIRLPDELAHRFKSQVSVRQRSRFIQRLLEEALPPEEVSNDDLLYQAALAVEKDAALAAEMGEREAATFADGFEEPGNAGARGAK
jgi:hypothetical protein